MEMDDREFLQWTYDFLKDRYGEDEDLSYMMQWIYDFLKDRHGEDEDLSYMRRFRGIIAALHK